MKKVTDEALVARLKENYAREQAGRNKKQGIEMIPNAWFFDEKDQAYYLRALMGEKPGAFLHRVSPSEL